MSAYLNAYYDPHKMDELIAEMGRERGAEIDLDCFFNDRRDQPPARVHRPAPIEAELTAAQGKNHLELGPTLGRAGPALLHPRPGHARHNRADHLRDTRYLSPGDIAKFLIQFETLLVEAAFSATAPTLAPATGPPLTTQGRLYDLAWGFRTVAC